MLGIAIAALLLAAGIVLVLAFLSVSKLIEKLKESQSDFFKAKIKNNYDKFGVEVVDVEVQDIFGNVIANESYASLDGVSASLYTNRIIYYNE